MAKSLPLVLMILDGWGYCEDKPNNAITTAKTPQWDAWWRTRPHALLEASGTAVGLPSDQMGNSEVGHMHIGSGRIIPQDLTRINEAIKNGEFTKNCAFIDTIQALKKSGGALHVLGLLSPGGVHSHENHLCAFLALCATLQFSKVYLHLFLDGRDTPPQSALPSLEKLNTYLIQYPVASIASLTGRYYAMDRDHRWERIEPVYRLLTEAQSDYHFETAEDAIGAFYEQKINDEFIPPTQIGKPVTINNDDSLFFFNFRSDRARQLTEAFISESFHGFVRNKTPKIQQVITMTHYADSLPTRCAFAPLIPKNTLGEVIANHGLRQLRIAETEKYAHVTFFLNGGLEKIFPLEKRLLIPSPTVATYDLVPEMSAQKLTNVLIESIEQGDFDVIICNYANADMVGHTGNFAATVHAIECLDTMMHDVWQALSKAGGQLLITADHGNAESMFDDLTQQPHTAHTRHPVPLLYVGGDWRFKKPEGSLIDVGPTLLALLKITPPKEMTGEALLVENHVTHR